MKKVLICFILALMSAITAGCSADTGSAYQMSPPAKGDTIAVMKTSMGDIKLKLFSKEAPKAVDNFVQLTKKGYYNSLTFHRVINNFMIQGGDPTGTGRGGKSIWGTPFKDEFSKKLHNFRGALSMANSGSDTNGSQFFINQLGKLTDLGLQTLKDKKSSKMLIGDYEKYGGTPQLDMGHTIFGQVYEGINVVDKIAAVKTGENDKPQQDVKIISMEISTVE